MLRSLCCVSLTEGRKEGRKEEGGSVCVLCAVVSEGCLVVHTFFGGRGALTCHTQLRPAQHAPSLKD